MLHLYRSRGGPRPLLRAAAASWPYAAVVLVYTAVRFSAFGIATGKQNEFPPMGPWTLVQSLSRLAFSYLSELVAPGLIDRLWLPRILAGAPDPTVLVAWLGLGGLAWWGVRTWRGRSEGAVVGLALAVLPVAPLLNIWAISGEDAGELLPFEAHRLYIPAAGFAALWALGLAGAVALAVGLVARFPAALSA